jgi:hypothetical protein
VILARFRGELEIGTEKCRAQFDDKLFHRIAFIAKPLAGVVTYCTICLSTHG